MLTIFRQSLAVTILICLSLTGCGEQLDPTRSYLSGAVTLDDQPLADAQVGLVTFHSLTGAPVAEGTTDAEGRYRIEDFRPSRYKVVIRKDQQTDAPYPIAMPTHLRPSVLSAIYSDPDKTQLSIETVEGEQTKDFALKSKPEGS